MRRVRDRIPNSVRIVREVDCISCDRSRRILVSDIYLRCLLEIFMANIMQSISLKLPKKMLEASDRCARALGIPRAEYIRRAVERMNREGKARTHAERIAQVSRKVRKESMRVNADFAAIERDPNA